VDAGSVRIITWKERRQNPAHRYAIAYSLCAAAAAVATLVVTYSALLLRMHAATEWLVR